MSKSLSFQKVTSSNTNSTNSTVDASNVIISGNTLLNTVSSLIATNNNEDALIQGCATLSGNNTFSGNNSIAALTIPSSMAVSSNAISISKLPRLSSSITPSNALDLATKAYADSTTLDIRPLNNTFTGTNTYNVCPQTSATAINNNDITNKSTVTNIVSTNIGAIVNNAISQVANVWTGPNTYNTVLPTSTVTPSHNNDLVTKTYVDTKSNISTNK